MSNLETTAILGGTGDLGEGLARRMLKAGYPIILGSRKLAKAEKEAAKLTKATGLKVEAMVNADAAAAADMAILTVPFAHQLSTLEGLEDCLKGKILVDTTVPLRPPRVGRVALPSEGCAAVRAQQCLGSKVRLVSAFQNIAAHLLRSDDPIQGDVLVCSDDKAAGKQVCGLVERIGLIGWYVGPLANSAAAEALTSILIQLNRQGFSNAGIKMISQQV